MNINKISNYSKRKQVKKKNNNKEQVTQRTISKMFSYPLLWKPHLPLVLCQRRSSLCVPPLLRGTCDFLKFSLGGCLVTQLSYRFKKIVVVVLGLSSCISFLGWKTLSLVSSYILKKSETLFQ